LFPDLGKNQPDVLAFFLYWTQALTALSDLANCVCIYIHTEWVVVTKLKLLLPNSFSIERLMPILPELKLRYTVYL